MRARDGRSGNPFGTEWHWAFASDFCIEKAIADQRPAFGSDVLSFGSLSESWQCLSRQRDNAGEMAGQDKQVHDRLGDDLGQLLTHRCTKKDAGL